MYLDIFIHIVYLYPGEGRDEDLVPAAGAGAAGGQVAQRPPAPRHAAAAGDRGRHGEQVRYPNQYPNLIRCLVLQTFHRFHNWFSQSRRRPLIGPSPG